MRKTDLRSKTKAELQKLAHRLGLRGISTMNKPELVDAVSRAKQNRGKPHKKTTPATSLKRRAVRKRSRAKIPVRKRTAGRRKATRGTREQTLTAAAATQQAAHKFDVTSAKRPPRQVFLDESLGELPDSYGSGRLFLIARDPQWLFAYWDFSLQQMADFRRQSVDARLVLRLFELNHPHPLQEITLAHDTQNWYLPSPKAATTYRAELGFWQQGGTFHVLSRSQEATAPPAALSADTTARFATIPLDLNFQELLDLVRHHLREGEPIAAVLARLQADGFQFPFRVNIELGPWTPEQSRQLERALGGELHQHVRVGSIDMAEWLRRRLQEETSSGLSSR